jgi:hypothetical protein
MGRRVFKGLETDFRDSFFHLWSTLAIQHSPTLHPLYSHQLSSCELSTNFKYGHEVVR